MNKAKLYFSDKSEQTREAAISRAVELANEAGFSGATITRTVGVWNGETEPGFTLEILCPNPYKVYRIGSTLAFEYEQESVLVVFSDVRSAVLVNARGEVNSL